MQFTQKLTESEVCFKLLFENASIGIVIVDGSGNIDRINSFACQIFGYKDHELEGRSIEILVPHGYREEHKQKRIEFFNQPRVRPNGFGLELFGQKKGGIVFPAEVSLSHYQSNGDNFAIAFITDISQRKANEEKYLNFFENSLVAMFVADLITLEVLDANETGAKLFGYSSIQDLISNFKIKNHFKNARNNYESRKRLFGGTIEGTWEEEVVRLDGSSFWATIFLKKNHDQSLVQFIVIDNTEIKRAHDALETQVEERTSALSRSLDRERKLNEMKSRFVSLASHEFQAPLSTILSSIFLVDQFNGPDQQLDRKKHIDRIRSSVKNLDEIIKDFLSVEKIEHGKLQAEFQNFNLKQLEEGVVEHMSNTLKPRQQLVQKFNGDFEEIWQDKMIVRNILLNLLSNASKYSNEGIIEMSILVDDKNVRITVSDNGIGIPEEQQKFIFGGFFRASNTRNIPGTGLGLSIVKNYVQLLGGTISFESKVEVGTTFLVEFPMNQQQS